MSFRRLFPRSGWLTCRLSAALVLLASATAVVACPLGYEAARLVLAQLGRLPSIDANDVIVL
jgi:hypothetical protein